jgi:hypothetical protein
MSDTDLNNTEDKELETQAAEEASQHESDEDKKSSEQAIRERAEKKAREELMRDPEFIHQAIVTNPAVAQALMEKVQPEADMSQQAAQQPEQQSQQPNQMQQQAQHQYLAQVEMAGRHAYGDDWNSKVNDAIKDPAIVNVLNTALGMSDPNPHETVYKILSSPRLKEITKMLPQYQADEIMSLRFGREEQKDMPQFKPIEKLQGTGMASPDRSISDEMEDAVRNYQ